MNDEPQNQPTAEPTMPSHVTTKPETMPGENYDPQIRAQYANEPRVVHADRQPDPSNFSISSENATLSQESRSKYPKLNLSDGEYVILDVKRHAIGMLLPVVSTLVILLALVAVLVFYPARPQDSGVSLPEYGSILPIILPFMLLVGLGGWVAVWVYLQNLFFLTNESVIQCIQQSLFSRHEQTISLGSIEDASFTQTGILQTMLGYGTIRLSTEGEESTYKFTYAQKPQAQVAVLNNAIESFKNGRPVKR
jgi:uncharacterized membrane protein YdbT with pleckstrin-like domain